MIARIGLTGDAGASDHRAERPPTYLRKLAVACVLFLLCLFAWFAFDTRREYVETRAHVEQHLRGLAVQIAAHARSVFDDALDALAAAGADIAQFRDADAPDRVARTDAVRRVLERNAAVEAFLVVDATGALLVAEGRNPAAGAALGEVGFAAFDRAAGREPIEISTVAVDAAGRHRVFLRRALADADGGVAGHAAAAVDLEVLRRVYDALRTGTAGGIALFRRDGLLLARAPHRADLVNRTLAGPLFARHLAEAPEGSFVAKVQTDNTVRVVGYAAVAGLPLVVAAGVPEATAFAIWRHIAAQKLAAFAVALGVLATLSWAVFRLFRGQERVWAGQVALERRFRELAETVPAFVYFTEPDGRSSFANRRWEEIAGPPDASNPARRWDAYIHPDDIEGMRRRWAEALASGTEHSSEFRLRCKDGAYRWQLSRARPIRDRDGRIVSWCGTAMDIDDVRRAEARYRGLFEQVPVAVLEAAPDGRILIANPAARRMFGIAEDADLSAVSIALRYADPADRERIKADHLRAGGGPMTFEVLRRRLDGTTFWAEQHVRATLDAEGRPELLHSIIIDITDRKLREVHEAEVRANQERYRALFEEVPVGVLETTGDGRIVAANPAARRLFGYGDRDDIGDLKVEARYADPEDRRRILAELKRGSGRTVQQLRLRRRDGTEFWTEQHVSATMDEGGRPQYLRSVFIDITDRKLRDQREAELRATEIRYRNLVESSAAAIVALDRTGNVSLWNPAAERLFGFTAEEVIGKRPPTIPEDRREEFEKRLSEALQGKFSEDLERIRRTKDGRIIHVLVRLAPLRDERGEQAGVISIVTDMTDRVRLERKLRQSEAFLRTVLDHARDAVIAIDSRGTIKQVNKTTETMFGYDSGALPGQNIGMLMPERYRPVHSRLLAEAGASVAESAVGAGREFEGLRRDGTEFPMELTAADIGIGGERGFVCTIRDLTQSRRLQAQLVHAQKMEAVGQLTGGIAHDFNNLLTVIIGNAELLRGALAGDARLARLAEMVGMAAQRGADLTQGLLAFSRRQSLTSKVTAIDLLVMRMDGLLRHALGGQIEIATIMGKELWQVMVDPAQLESAILNLALNARDAMPGGGRLTIEAANVALDAERRGDGEAVTPGPYVMIAVSDTGTGMAPEVASRVFEPFFTTKAIGKGTGLGLSMVYGFVRQSGGHVEIESRVGAGTTVRLYLPRAKGQADPAETPAGPAAASGGGETILLTEGDNLVRANVETQLAHLGYRVLSARDGNEALAHLRGGAAVDLLFTDVVMPGGIDGMKLAAEARRLRPGLKVLFTTGYPGTAELRDAIACEDVIVLSKPYRRAELAAKLREALESPRRTLGR
jgi:PAS domain S-box-containing protein